MSHRENKPAYGFVQTGMGNDDAVHKLRALCGHETAEQTRRHLQLWYMAQEAGVEGSTKALARFADLIRADMRQEGFDRLDAIRRSEQIHPLLEYNGPEEVIRRSGGPTSK